MTLSIPKQPICVMTRPSHSRPTHYEDSMRRLLIYPIPRHHCPGWRWVDGSKIFMHPFVTPRGKSPGAAGQLLSDESAPAPARWLGELLQPRPKNRSMRSRLLNAYFRPEEDYTTNLSCRPGSIPARLPPPLPPLVPRQPLLQGPPSDNCPPVKVVQRGLRHAIVPLTSADQRILRAHTRAALEPASEIHPRKGLPSELRPEM